MELDIVHKPVGYVNGLNPYNLPHSVSVGSTVLYDSTVEFLTARQFEFFFKAAPACELPESKRDG
jgi:hypothetical protein